MAPALLSRFPDMHLTRVQGGASGTVGAAAATGGDADLLALLVGGDNAADASAFPTALEAAIAGGVATDGSSDDAATDAIDVLVATDGAQDGDGDASAVAIDAALAAALAIGGGTVPATDTATAAVDGPDAALAATAVAADVHTAEAAEAAAAKGVAEAATAATTGKVAATAATEQQTAKSAATEIPAPAAEPSAAAWPAAETAAPGEAGETTHPTATPRAGDRASDVETRSDSAALAEARSPTHDGDRKLAFSASAGHEHGLDLGSEDENTALTTPAAPEKPGHVHTATGERVAVVTIEHGGAGIARSEATADPHGTGVDGPPAPLATAAGTAHEATIGKSERGGGQHFGAIEPRWSERVADAVRLSALRGGGDIRLQLEPEGLGHIDVRIQLHQDGVRAVIVAEHESTRQLLTNQQHLLQDAFARSDLRLSDFSVDVGTGGNAAAFARGDGDGQQQAARSSGAETATGATTADPGDTGTAAAATLGNGRVNVRV